MARYIDSDALREKMFHEAFEKDSQDQKWDSGCWIRYHMFENAVDSIPTADVVEVVRCKECKHSSQKVHICEITNYLYGENYFCAWGERRTDDGEIH